MKNAPVFLFRPSSSLNGGWGASLIAKGKTPVSEDTNDLSHPCRHSCRLGSYRDGQGHEPRSPGVAMKTLLVNGLDACHNLQGSRASIIQREI
jgi:hypothetical protein